MGEGEEVIRVVLKKEDDSNDDKNLQNLEGGKQNDNSEGADDLEDKKKADESEIVIDDEKVKSFLKEKGIDFEDYEDLKPKQKKELNPEIEKFIEFSERTGNANYSDFLKTQKEWEKEDTSNILKEALKLKYPMLDEAKIERQYNKIYGYDENVDDEETILDKQTQIEIDKQEALKLLNERKKEYEVDRSSDKFIPEPYKQAKKALDDIKTQQEKIKEVRNDFLAKTEKLFSELTEGFEVKVGDEKLKFKPVNLDEVKTMNSDIANIQKKYFDDNQRLTNPHDYHLALTLASDPHKFAEHFYNLGKAKQEELSELESKNISIEGRKAGANGAGKTIYRIVD
jgi:hypothetical protein